MALITSLHETKPDFVNELGTKWWIEKDLTNYCKKEDQYGTKLEATAFLVELVNGARSYVVVKNNQIIAESQSLETISIEIDVRKYLIRTEGGK